MKKIFFSIFLLSVIANLQSQEVISSAGNTISNANGSIAYTLGELKITSHQNSSNVLTQGFHQPILSSINLDSFNNLKVKIFPNPTMDIVNIKLLNFDNLNFVLYDIQGRHILQSTIEDRFYVLNLKNLAQGVYVLRVGTENSDQYKSYRIIKN